jgi:hypothetical protein
VSNSAIESNSEIGPWISSRNTNASGRQAVSVSASAFILLEKAGNGAPAAITALQQKFVIS